MTERTLPSGAAGQPRRERSPEPDPREMARGDAAPERLQALAPLLDLLADLIAHKIWTHAQREILAETVAGPVAEPFPKESPALFPDRSPGHPSPIPTVPADSHPHFRSSLTQRPRVARPRTAEEKRV